MSLCPYCGGELKLRDATFIYSTPKAKHWPSVWVCENYPQCDAYVGCHPNTTTPLGRPANARLRTLKKEAHKQFDPIWKSGFMTRKEAYRWLAKELDMTEDECHIGMFDIKDCQRVIHLCRKVGEKAVVRYRKEHYGYEMYEPKKPTFSRGYDKTKHGD